ncbi:UPF0280 family protein [Maridesulfovibrio bastinii]|uniref:UPF0280 family protein n=1 Tax=Maridesulfovibrio bastinii TaxID=47157 RepID=UPI0003FC72BB|nr:UPF0280 family protein [Maridesulfovibrio bastinii]
MKKHYSDHNRAYRKTVKPAKSETSFQVVVAQTDLFIVADKDFSSEALQAVHEARALLQSYILLHPEFAESLVPVEVEKDASEIIRRMADSSALCNVGPMAAVAGAVAQFTAEKLAKQSKEVLVENGGDTYLISSSPRTVGLLSDPESGTKVGLKLEAEDFPVSICSSSGKIGHSLSLGCGDLVTVRAKDARFADAAATALANLLKSPQDVPLVIEKARQLSESGLDGIFVQFDSKIGAWGKIELVSL